jgi:D-alanyl-D-alanine carboxypeptidase (penicillin-binding protein 5/6)
MGSHLPLGADAPGRPLDCRAVRRGFPVVAAIAVLATAVAGSATAGAPNVQAAAYVVESSVDGSTLAARSADASRPVASITKLMTALVARRSLAVDQVVSVPRAATSVGESTIALRQGQRITVGDLLIGTLVPSANDAATTLAYVAGRGSVDRFVARMNATARELGLAGTHFRNPHGLDQPGHVSTARDVAHLLRVALRDPFIRRYAGSSRAVLSSGTVVTSTDNLFGRVPGFVGGKTGHTDGAGWSQVAVARRAGTTITAAVLGAPSEEQRDDDIAALLRYGLAAYRPSKVVAPSRVYASVRVGWGRAPVGLVATRPIVRPAPTGRPLVERVIAPVTVALPVQAGARLGTVVVTDGTRVVARAPLVAARSVARPGRLAQGMYVARRTVHHLLGWTS